MTFAPVNARSFLCCEKVCGIVENFGNKIVDKIVFVVYNRGRKDKYEPRIKETRRRA
jgi:hypothetical protein